MKYLIAFLFASGCIALICATIYNERKSSYADETRWPVYYGVCALVSAFTLLILTVTP